MTTGTPPDGAMLAIIPVRDGVLPLGADEAVAEAGGWVLLIGSGCDTAYRRMAGVARSVHTLEAGHFAAGSWADLLAGIVPDLQPVAPGRHLLLPASPDGRDLGPRLAATLGWDFVPSAIRVGATTAEITRFGGRVSDTLALGGPVVATLQPGVRGVEIEPADADQEDHRGEPMALVAPDRSRYEGRHHDPRLVEMLPADPSTMDLAEAERIVCGGAGLGSPEAFEQLRNLADRIGASTGGTRVVTDWGWLPVERQIGTTGVTVDPSLYLALGVSGAVQHTAGLGSPDHVISVNLDPYCPMMGLADLAIVCDGPALVRELLLRL